MATWLLTRIVTDSVLFGLCDLGQSYLELGYISRAEIEAVRDLGSLRIERDIHFEPLATSGVYVEADRIVQNNAHLSAAHLRLAEQLRNTGK